MISVSMSVSIFGWYFITQSFPIVTQKKSFPHKILKVEGKDYNTEYHYNTKLYYFKGFSLDKK